MVHLQPGAGPVLAKDTQGEHNSHPVQQKQGQTKATSPVKLFLTQVLLLDVGELISQPLVFTSVLTHPVVEDFHLSCQCLQNSECSPQTVFLDGLSLWIYSQTIVSCSSVGVVRFLEALHIWNARRVFCRMTFSFVALSRRVHLYCWSCSAASGPG